MSEVPVRPSVLVSDQRARAATSVTFFMAGAAWGNWIPRIPDVKSALDIDNSQVGLALLGTALGSVVAMQFVGYLMSRHGTRAIVRVTTPLLMISLLSVPLLDFSLWGLFAAMVILGSFHGSLDVAMNGHCIAIERRYRRPIVNSMHALFSLGGVSGAITGGVAASHSLSLGWHFFWVALVGVLVSVATSKYLLTKATELGTLPLPSHTGDQAHAPLRQVLTRPALVLSLLALCAFVAEGGINDWVTIYMRDHLAGSAAAAATAYGVFQGMMALVRLVADPGVHRWGPVRILRLSTAVGAAGLAVGILSNHIVLAIVGFGFAGLGVAVVVPLIFSAAGHTPSVDSARTLSVVTTAGYLGFFVGPPLLGHVADWSLNGALLIPVLLIAFVSLQSGLAKDASGHTTSAKEAEADTSI